MVNLLDGLPVAKVGRPYSYASSECVRAGVVAHVQELLHLFCEVPWCVERGSANVDIHHELSMRGPNRCIEAPPCLETTAE